MKKLISLFLMAGLCFMTFGCSSDPGESVETEVTETEMEEMDAMADVASEAALQDVAPKN